MHQTQLRIKFREKPAAVEGEVLRRGGSGERGGSHRGSAVSLPGSGTPRSSELLLLLSDAPDGTGLQVSTWWRSRGQRCSICLSLRAPSLASFRLPQAEMQVSPRKAEVSARPPGSWLTLDSLHFPRAPQDLAHESCPQGRGGSTSFCGPKCPPRGQGSGLRVIIVLSSSLVHGAWQSWCRDLGDASWYPDICWGPSLEKKCSSQREEPESSLLTGTPCPHHRQLLITCLWQFISGALEMGVQCEGNS